jgi:hypothetical protein
MSNNRRWSAEPQMVLAAIHRVANIEHVTNEKNDFFFFFFFFFSFLFPITLFAGSSNFKCANGSFSNCRIDVFCRGTESTCQSNIAPDNALCRSSQGPCDEEERCMSGSCPSDSFATAGTVCRASVDPSSNCDPEEQCTGLSASCPMDVQRNGVQCRAAQGECDLAEICNSGRCPKRPLQGQPLKTAVDHRPNAKIKRNVPVLMANVQVQHQRATAFHAVHRRLPIRLARCDKCAVALEAVVLLAFAQRILV